MRAPPAGPVRGEGVTLDPRHDFVVYCNLVLLTPQQCGIGWTGLNKSVAAAVCEAADNRQRRMLLARLGASDEDVSHIVVLLDAATKERWALSLLS
eukprot:SAG31_NODE_6210_length_2120_cov_1.196932_1_plen_96_part_00